YPKAALQCAAGAAVGTLLQLIGEPPDNQIATEARRQHLADHCVNLKGATFLASSIAGCSTRTSCKKRIQVLRMPISPSGRRRRWGPATSARVRNTASASTNRMLPNQVDDRILAAVGGHGVLPKYYLQLRRACGKKRSSTLRSAGCGFSRLRAECLKLVSR